MLTYRKLSELSIEDCVTLWNQGFEHYFVTNQLTVSSFLTRTVNEHISLEDSFAAYADGVPIGIVANGLRTIDGKKVAWNGGTGIVPAYRGKGMGKLVMERNLELYRELGVELAMLEALSQNEPAIRLYKSVGYEIIDQLAILQKTEPLASDNLQASEGIYTYKKGLPNALQTLPFYRHTSAWQTHWSGIRDGESLLVYSSGEVVGYALYKRTLDAEGRLSAITLYQCEVLPGRTDEEAILRAALLEVFYPLEAPCKRMTMNLRKSNAPLIAILEQLGFTTWVEQVHMVRPLTASQG
ncbi:GNAT family N-acetyltransferase [Paenibacillus aestuarii]|uniref:GNAT family N-acetyltransferase n=1 Tax=Paenibacillus aestuarii TaxID=516965 RepID=A0ABW0K3E9_9BACL|nr:GNAT family N-acetyltransferase [Paenibacillus aestuarii]